MTVERYERFGGRTYGELFDWERDLLKPAMSDERRARLQAAGAILVFLFVISKITFLVLFIGIHEYGWWS